MDGIVFKKDNSPPSPLGSVSFSTVFFFFFSEGRPTRGLPVPMPEIEPRSRAGELAQGVSTVIEL
jgi:hypothetical protein